MKSEERKQRKKNYDKIVHTPQSCFLNAGEMEDFDMQEQVKNRSQK